MDQGTFTHKIKGIFLRNTNALSVCNDFYITCKTDWNYKCTCILNTYVCKLQLWYICNNGSSSTCTGCWTYIQTSRSFRVNHLQYSQAEELKNHISHPNVHLHTSLTVNLTWEPVTFKGRVNCKLCGISPINSELFYWQYKSIYMYICKCIANMWHACTFKWRHVCDLMCPGIDIQYFFKNYNFLVTDNNNGDPTWIYCKP